MSGGTLDCGISFQCCLLMWLFTVLMIALTNLGAIMLLDGLVQVHYIAHHFGMECKGMAHAFLNFKLIIMISIIIVTKKTATLLLILTAMALANFQEKP